MDLVEREDKSNLNALLNEWEQYIDELSQKEVALYQWREVYNVRAMEIENTVDFKSLYGKNNADIRKQHIKEELKDWHDTIKELEWGIDWLTRRIVYMKELIRTKRTLLEVKG